MGAEEKFSKLSKYFFTNIYWIFYLPSNFFTMAHGFIQLWQGGLPVRSTGKKGRKSSLYPPFACHVDHRVSVKPPLRSFLHKMWILLHTEQSQGSQTGQVRNRVALTILSWVAAKAALTYCSTTNPLLIVHIFFLYTQTCPEALTHPLSCTLVVPKSS